MKSLRLTKFIGLFLFVAIILASYTQYSFADVTGNANEQTEVTEAEIGSFEKYTPCNELDIPMSNLSQELIVGKLTGKHTKKSTVVVWTNDELSEQDKDSATKSISTIPGIGNPKIYEFYNGSYVSLPNYGLTIDAADAKIIMDDPSCWALFAGATFKKGSVVIHTPEDTSSSDAGILDTKPEHEEDTPLVAPPDEIENPPEEIILPENITPTEAITEPIIEPVTDNTLDTKEIASYEPVNNGNDVVDDTKTPSYNNINANSSNKNLSDFPKTGDNNFLFFYLSILIIASLSLYFINRAHNNNM